MATSSIMILKRGWTEEEDEMLKSLIRRHGARNWPTLSRSIEGRSGKSCRLRWINYLDPKLYRGPFSPEEDRIIIEAHARLGNKWAAIARLLKRRSDNSVKNRWNHKLKRRVLAINVHRAAQERRRRQENVRQGSPDTYPSTRLTLALIPTVDVRESTAAAAAVAAVGDNI